MFYLIFYLLFSNLFPNSDNTNSIVRFGSVDIEEIEHQISMLSL